MTAKKYPTAKEALLELERRHGKHTAHWVYHNANGKPVGLVVRWELDGAKDIRPISLYADGWRIAAMPTPRPLYHLPQLASAETVYVVEGEKCAERLAQCGVVTTTSAGGSQAANKSDWSPLRGKQVIILPDHDAAGESYADQVARLCQQAGAHSIQIIRLSEYAPNLPEGGDVADLLDDPDWCGLPLGESATREDFIQWSKRLVERLPCWQPLNCIEMPEDQTYCPVPLEEALPKVLRSFVETGAKAIGCDAAYLVLPLLAGLGSAIGNTRRLELKRGWYVPPIIWSVMVGESGTAKTPAFRLAMRAIRDRQARAFQMHDEELQNYEERLRKWEAEPKLERGEKPKPPICVRYVVADTTIEALAPILAQNPRGLLLARDELAGWIGSFDRYAKGRSVADSANWLSMFNGESVIVDRKSNAKTIHIPQAAVCVTGGIQPGILKRALTNEHRESGLAARLLMAWPPRKSKKWTEADIDPDHESKMRQLFDRLYDLQLSGDGRPELVRLDRDAKNCWVEYYNRHALEQAELGGDLAAAWSKLEEYAARLALIFHFVRWAAGEILDPSWLDATSMHAGITLTQWFKRESRRVYGLLAETEEETNLRLLLEFIQRKGGTVTPRDVQRGVWHLRGADPVKELDRLRLQGWGDWFDLPSKENGGRPTKAFRLASKFLDDHSPLEAKKSSTKPP